MVDRSGARRVVVTGLGVVTPIGLTVNEFWGSIREGKSGVSKLGALPQEDLDELKIKIAAQIKDFDPKARLKNYKRDKIIAHADRYSWFAAAAAEEAHRQRPGGQKTRVAAGQGSRQRHRRQAHL